MEAACARALDAEAVSVPLIGRMIERATEGHDALTRPPQSPGKPARFERDPQHFATTRPTRAQTPADGQQELGDAEGGAA